MTYIRIVLQLGLTIWVIPHDQEKKLNDEALSEEINIFQHHILVTITILSKQFLYSSYTENTQLRSKNALYVPSRSIYSGGGRW